MTMSIEALFEELHYTTNYLLHKYHRSRNSVMDHGVYGGEESESRTMCRGYNLSEYYVQIGLMPMVIIQVLITAVVQAYESDLTEG